MFSIYLIDRKKRIYSLVNTEDKNEAIRAYKDKIFRKELSGRKIKAVLKNKDTNIEMYSFYAQIENSDSINIPSSIEITLIN